ncbi:MAG: hypothetical protein WD402_02180 [Chloroflexota bacterium]
MKWWTWLALAVGAYLGSVAMLMLTAPLAWTSGPESPLPAAAYIASMLLVFLMAPLLAGAGLISLLRSARRQPR